MIKPADTLIRFKIRQAVGSMAIEGIRVSKSIQETMLGIARGELSAQEERAAVVAKHRKANHPITK